MLKKFLSKKKLYKSLKKDVENARLGQVLARAKIDLFLDVGGNIGQTGKALRAVGYEGDIVSYEPVGACHAMLLETSAADNRWRIADRCALGDRPGEIEILVSEATDLSSIAAPTEALKNSLPKVAEELRESVPLKRLDEVAQKEVAAAKNPFLKIDAQGYDLKVLNGADGLMSHLKGLQVEMSLLPLYEGEALYLELLTRIHALGFEPHLLVDRGYSRDLDRQLQVDGVFLKK